jgi:caffeoyl-CoA O-methyltransferase
MDISDKEIEKYTLSHTTEEPEIVKKLVRASEEDLEFTDMMSGRQVGMLLRFFVRLIKPNRILEVGTFTGYSTLMMAQDLPEDSEILTLEMNPRYQKVSKQFFSLPEYEKKIYQVMGNAFEVIPKIEGHFDLIYLDADKAHYPEYYRMLKEKMSEDGYLLIDNVLWEGTVLEHRERKAEAIHRMNQEIATDDTVEQVMLPVRDGLTILRFANKEQV